MPKALIFLTHGFEEMETVAPVDFLRRAGVAVTLAGVGLAPDLLAKGRNDMVLRADTSFASVASERFDLIVVPGGPGHKTLRENEEVLACIRRHDAAGALTGAICAGPTVLAAAGVIRERRHTGHFSVASELPYMEEEPVIRDGTLLTSRGAGTAHSFALALVRALCGEEAAREVSASTCMES